MPSKAKRPPCPPAPPDKTSLLSNVLVVDMAGGKKLPTLPGKAPLKPEEKTDQFNKKLPAQGNDGKDRAAYSPGEILVMEPDGTLVVRSEFDDMATVDSYTTTPDQMLPGGVPGGMRGYGPPPGMGGYEPGMPVGRGAQGYGPPSMRGGVPGMEGGHGGYGELFGGPAPKQTPTPRKGR